MDKLKNCPFCGGKVTLDEWDDEAYMVCCDSCHCGVSFGVVFEDGTAGDASKEETVERWNKRVSQTTVNQYGNNNSHITNCGTLNLTL